LPEIEVTAKSIAEATELAAAQLGVSPDEVAVEVVDTPRKILGLLGGGQFTVRAWLKGEKPEDDASEGAAEGAELDEGLDDELDDELETFEEPEVEELIPEGGPKPLEKLPELPELRKPVGRDAAETIGRQAVQVCQDIMDLVGLEAVAKLTEVTQGEVSVELDGQGLGLIIGRHGATLDALQLLVAIIANRHTEDGARVVIDAEDYRKRRRELLVRMAQAHAARAKRTGKEVVIPDLKAFERRIVHLTLEADEDVHTYSEGYGDARQLVISPRERS
jgi:spoIIIJ-associated protein